MAPSPASQPLSEGRVETAPVTPRRRHFRPLGRGLHGSSLTILSPATSTRSSATLVELESELEDLLVDYEAVTGAWPKEPHILTRANAGRQVEDLLGRIYETQRAIATSQAKTLSCASEDQEGCGMSASGYERTY
jgi:hypothetical protein